MDLSFISLKSVLPAVWALLREGGTLVALVKPQFEAGKAEVDRGRGVIRDAAVQQALAHDETVLIEKYVRGIEITIGVLDFPGEPLTALPVIEIVPKGEYYDYESKYAAGGSEHAREQAHAPRHPGADPPRRSGRAGRSGRA